MSKRVLVKILKCHLQKAFFPESTMGMILASKTLFPACEILVLPTMEQSLILSKAGLAQTCGILVPDILGNDLQDV